jgi:hypothetical protein
MIDPVLSAAIWERYEQDRPRPGRDYTAWVARMSEESATSATVIRRIVGEGAGAMLNAIDNRIQTYAQKIAEIMGADLVAALDVLREALSATKKKVLLDKQGRPKLIDVRPEEEGGPGFLPENMIYVETPDWPSRLSAIRTMVEIHGARAPQQFEINQKTVTLDLTPNAALAELARLADAIPRLQSALAASGAGSPRLIGAGTTAEVSTRHQ